MATFTFNKKQLDQVRRFWESADKPKLFFQPTHHGGCLQVLDGDRNASNTFCTKRTGYKTLCRATLLLQDARELTDEGRGIILTSKWVKFIVNVSDNKVTHRLLYKANKQ